MYIYIVCCSKTIFLFCVTWFELVLLLRYVCFLFFQQIILSLYSGPNKRREGSQKIAKEGKGKESLDGILSLYQSWWASSTIIYRFHICRISNARTQCPLAERMRGTGGPAFAWSSYLIHTPCTTTCPNPSLKVNTLPSLNKNIIFSA